VLYCYDDLDKNELFSFVTASFIRWHDIKIVKGSILLSFYVVNCFDTLVEFV